MVDEGRGAIGYYYYYYSGETGVVDFRGVEPLVVCPSLTSAKEESDERKDHPEAEVVRESELAEYKIDRDEDRQELQP